MNAPLQQKIRSPATAVVYHDGEYTMYVPVRVRTRSIPAGRAPPALICFLAPSPEGRARQDIW